MTNPEQHAPVIAYAAPALAVLVVLAIFAGLIAFGCGKKSWPEPMTVRERFAWSEVQASRSGPCLTVRAHMTGTWANLNEVALELSPTEEAGACASCPFHPSIRAVFWPSQAGLTLDGPELRLEYCRLDPATRYRYRLVGKNVFSGLADAHSSIQITPESQ